MPTIHQLIKTAREAKKWSMQYLADEISKAEDLSKPLTWQTVQQWEKDGGTAPRRKRMETVARLLDLDVAEMVGGEPAAVLHDITAQLTVLSLTLGCTLKATAHREPDRAKAIEDNLRLLMEAHDMATWPERAKSLLDLMYTALQERVEDVS